MTKTDNLEKEYRKKRNEMAERFPTRIHPGDDGGWLWMDAAFTRFAICGRMAPYMVAVYAVLCMYADNYTQTCFPAHSTISEQTGMSVTQVKKALHLLRKNNVILWRQQYTQRNGKQRQTTNKYKLLAPHAWYFPQAPQVRRLVSVVANTADGDVDDDAVQEWHRWQDNKT